MQSMERKGKDLLPEVGKYYPKYELIVNRPIKVEFSKYFEKPSRADPIKPLKSPIGEQLVNNYSTTIIE